MNSRKLRVLALLLSAIMIFTAVPSTLFAGEFGDGVVSDWDDTVNEPVASFDGSDVASDDSLSFEAADFEAVAAEMAEDGFTAEIADDLVGDTSAPYDLSNTTNIGEIVFYYNQSGHKDGEVEFIRKQVSGGAEQTKGSIVPAAKKVTADVDYIASDITELKDKATDGKPAKAVVVDLKSATLKDDLDKADAEDGKSYYASVKGDCTQVVIVAKIDGTVYVSKPFTKYNYLTKKEYVHDYKKVKPADDAEYYLGTSATCTTDGVGYIDYQCANKGCEATKTDSVTLKATGHVFKFAYYALGDNATWAATDVVRPYGTTYNTTPVAKDFTKETFSYVIHKKCDFCDATEEETVTEPVNAGTLTYANAKNIYEPEKQLTGSYLNPETMIAAMALYKAGQASVIDTLRFADCLKSASYDIVFINKDGTSKTLLKVEIEASAEKPHHSNEPGYVTKNGSTFVALSSALFDTTQLKETGKIYSKVCVPLDYYQNCKWCEKVLAGPTKTATDDEYWDAKKYGDNHNFGLNPSALAEAKTYEEVKKLVDDANKAANATLIQAYYIPNPEKVEKFDCEKGIDVTFGYKCPQCGNCTEAYDAVIALKEAEAKAEEDEKQAEAKAEEDEKQAQVKAAGDEEKKKEYIKDDVVKDLNYPLTLHVTISHNFEYEKNDKESRDATCTTAGVLVYDGKCSRCGKTDRRVVPVAALGHLLTDKDHIYAGVTGDTLIDSVRDRLYKKNGVYGNHIGMLEDYTIGVEVGYLCQRAGCGYIDPIKGTTSLKITDVAAKTIDQLNKRTIKNNGGFVTLAIDAKDEAGKDVDFQIVNSEGKLLTSGNLTKDTYLEKTPALEKNEFKALFGLVSIDYTVPTTVKPVESTTTKETPSESTSEETPAESSTKETPAESTTKEAPVEPTTKEVPVEPTTAEPATMPAQVKGLKVTKNSPTKKIIAVKYAAVDNADQYTVNVRKAGTTAWTKNLTDGAVTAYEITGLTRGEAYDIRVAAIAKGIAGPRSAHQYRWLEKVTLDKPKKAGAGAVSVTWSEAPGASKYKVYYSTDKSFKTDVKTGVVKSNSAIVNELEVGKTYYFKVRCYKTIDGITYTGAWSNVKSKIMK